VGPGGEYYFVVAVTGKMANTETAMSTVKHMLKLAPETLHHKIERMREMTDQAREALEKKSKHGLGFFLNEAQKELEAIGVSDSNLNRLIQIARQEGAIGAKLTGGGKGGCIIALAKNEMHAKQLEDKLTHIGAAAVRRFTLK